MREYFSGDEVKVVVDIAGRGYSEFQGVLEDENVDLDAHNYQVHTELNTLSGKPSPV